MDYSFILRSVFILSFFFQCVFTTRYLPMIVWDHLNPLVSCKCNWFPLPTLDIYDHVQFVCPSLKVGVRLLDGYSRPTTEMNENLFVRTWKGSDEDLKRSLQNGSFCDPKQADKKYTCRNGQGDKGRDETIQEANLDDTVVYFNNGDNGKQATLNSMEAKCAMVFAFKVKDNNKVKHDMSYGKCFNANDYDCDDINATCKSQCNAPKCSVSPTPTRVYQGQLCTSLFSERLKQATQTQSITCTGNVAESPGARSGNSNFVARDFGFGILLGILVGVAVAGLCFLTQRYQAKHRKTTGSAGEKNPEESRENSRSQQGFHNKGFSKASSTVPLAEKNPEDKNDAPPKVESPSSHQ